MFGIGSLVAAASQGSVLGTVLSRHLQRCRLAAISPASVWILGQPQRPAGWLLRFTSRVYVLIGLHLPRFLKTSGFENCSGSRSHRPYWRLPPPLGWGLLITVTAPFVSEFATRRELFDFLLSCPFLWVVCSWALHKIEFVQLFAGWRWQQEIWPFCLYVCVVCR